MTGIMAGGPSRVSLDVGGTIVGIALFRRARASRYILRVRPAYRDIQITIPSHGSVGEAHDFINRHIGWIHRHVSAFPEPHRFQDGAVFPYRGCLHRIVHLPHGDGTVHVDDPLHVPRATLPEITVSSQADPGTLRRLLRRWLKIQARERLELKTLHYADALGVRFTSLTIGDQVTRWGACSSRGRLSFSWRLIMAPDNVLDYLAAHEVTHLRFMDHSDRYWRALSSIFPQDQIKRAEKWLKVQANDLHRYDRG